MRIELQEAKISGHKTNSPERKKKICKIMPRYEMPTHHNH